MTCSKWTCTLRGFSACIACVIGPSECEHCIWSAHVCVARGSISAVPLSVVGSHPSGACSGIRVRALQHRAFANSSRRHHRRLFPHHRRPSRIREGRQEEVVGRGARMAHALLARGLRALLRAHQAAVHPWASPAQSAALAGAPVPCSGCGGVAAALSSQATASSSSQHGLAAQRGRHLHTAVTAAAQGAQACSTSACLPNTPSHGVHAQQSQHCRMFRTTSGNVRKYLSPGGQQHGPRVMAPAHRSIYGKVPCLA